MAERKASQKKSSTSNRSTSKSTKKTTGSKSKAGASSARSKTAQSRKKTTGKKTTGTKRKTKAQQAQDAKVKYELKLVALATFTLMSILSMHTTSMGAVGLWLRNVYFGLFSTSAYVLPYFILVTVFLAINPNMKVLRGRYIAALCCAILAVVLMSATQYYQAMIEAYDFNGLSLTTFTGVQESFTDGAGLKYGGVVGNMLAGITMSMLGKYGVYILIGVLWIISLLLGTRVSLLDMWEKRTAITEKAKQIELNIPELPKPKKKPDSLKQAKKQMKSMKKATKTSRGDQAHKERIHSENTQVRAGLSTKVKDLRGFDSDAFLADKPLEVEQTLPAYIDPVESKQASAPVDAEQEPIESITFKDFVERDTVPKADQTAESEAQSAEANLAEKKKQDKLRNSDIDEETKQNVESSIQQSVQEEYASYRLPSVSLLGKTEPKRSGQERQAVMDKARKLEETLNHFGVEAKVVQISRGPTVTMFELQPSPGVKVSKITNLSDDIALSLAAHTVRIVAPIPGKSAVGVEVPNENKSLVGLREALESKHFKDAKSKLTFALGKDISGNPITADLGKMPHMLIAGATGSGKSVCVNTLISSILFNAKPDEVKFLMVDPKVVELSTYNGIPHLILPVVTDPKKAAIALNWAVQEMTRRYQLFAETGVKDSDSYNKKAEKHNATREPETPPMEKLAKIVVIIDELADLMMVAPDQVEDAICRLAQMARAAGIHLIVATQRPSVDVITGVIKANIPSRIAFAVSSNTDSRTILDMAGAEKLLGQGDMLFYPVGASKPKRIQGAYISDDEVEELVDQIKSQVDEIDYDEEILSAPSITSQSDEADELLSEAIDFVVQTQKASASMLQRKFRVGYNRAARMVDDMEERGIVGPNRGSKPREVIMSAEELAGEEAE